MRTSGPLSPRILIVDDDSGIRRLISYLLELEGITSLEASSGEEALATLRQGQVDLVLLDVNMPGLDGMRTLKEAKKLPHCPPIVLVTAHASIDTAVEAVKSGACDCVTKPFKDEELMHRVRQALAAQWSRKQRAALADDAPLALVMGTGVAVSRLIREVERVAPTDFTVVISGETGSGKELVARAIHRLSRRAAKPFVPVDCGAIPPSLIESELFGHEKGAFTGADRPHVGKFEAATGGTLFLDEVQNLPLAVQNKFLRALQERHITRVGGTGAIYTDIRVVAACNQDLMALVAAGQFREDLYHRLNEFALAIPPLRQRRDDMLYLAQRFIETTAAELERPQPQLSPAAAECLLAYSWPGNVRQLRNVIRRAVLLADAEIETAHLGLSAATAATPTAEVTELPFDGQESLKEIVRRQVADIEREVLRRVLLQTRGNKAKAARLLQIDYKTIQTKVKEYNLQGILAESKIVV